MDCELRLGDCLEQLKLLDDNSIDSLVTDPPAGISFMGKDWDGDKGGSKQWIAWMSQVMQECLRVLKPGAHGLVWAIPRNSHWTATALEDAGFEIRDVVTHLFGSGFPKSLDISKAIDKAAGAERIKLGSNPNHRKTKQGQVHETGTMCGEPHTGDGSMTLPATAEASLWQGFGTALKPASEHWILIRKPCSEKTVAANVLKHGCGGINIDASRIGNGSDKTKGGCVNNWTRGGEDAGYSGDRDKVVDEIYSKGRFPANLVLSHNPDCVELGVKKVKGGGGGKGQSTPIKQGVTEFKTNQNRSLVTHRENGTETVSAFECTEGCPIQELDRQSWVLKSGARTGPNNVNSMGERCYGKYAYTGGKSEASEGGASRFFQTFDENGCTPGCAVAELDRQSGVLTSGSKPGQKGKAILSDSEDARAKTKGLITNAYGDSGGASRFFYCAKASKREKNAGCDLEVKKAVGDRPNSADLTGKFPDHDQRERVGNFHPTVKATKLMSYLIKMVTPPGGTVLDPFAGSGSTGVSAVKEGFKFIGIEQNKEYIEIAEKRIYNALPEFKKQMHLDE
jgi:hypothetical protein